MSKNPIKNRKFTIIFVIILLVSFTALISPKVNAILTIFSINPTEGYVGTVVSINGTIETINGLYKILFNGKEVANGTAVAFAVQAKFTIPNLVGGSYEVTLYDVNATKSSTPVTFTVKTAYHIKAIITPPKQYQEGQNVTICANVTGGMANTVYSANITVENPQNITSWILVQLSNTTDNGYGEKVMSYPTDFGPQATTNYTGLYKMEFNGTALNATGSFFVGLTNATEYHRYQVVNIQAVGYMPEEPVNVTITYQGKVVFTKSPLNASLAGIVNMSWTIPANASLGTYTVTVSNYTTPGTVKQPPDIQEFNITSVTYPCHIQVLNLNNKPVENVEVEAYAKDDVVNASSLTDENGFASFPLEAGRYNIKAFWKNSEVGNLTDLDVSKEINVTMTCKLARIITFISDEVYAPLPFINVTVTYNYTTREGDTILAADWLETNYTGRIMFDNVFLNINYTLKASRYNHVFNTTHIKNLTQSTLEINIVCPTYTMLVGVTDSKGQPMPNIRVAAYEWKTGLGTPADEGTTDLTGNITLHCTFGRYRLRVYENDVILNETESFLVQDPTFLQIQCILYNLPFHVKVVDFFGQPIPNINVTLSIGVEVEFGGSKQLSYSAFTLSDGTASFDNIIGGNCTVLVYLGGDPTPCETMSLNLNKPKSVTIKIDGYVIIGGMLLRTSDLATIIVLTVIAILFASVLAYQKLFRKTTAEEKENEKV